MAHAGHLTLYQQAQLFTGGLPEHIRIDVELHDPQDMQRGMSLVCAYERRNSVPALALSAPPLRPPRHTPATITALPPAAGATGAQPVSSSAPSRQFKWLTLAEMADRRKLGQCYNCDEPYVHGHKCQHLFYLEVSNNMVEEPEEDEEPDVMKPPKL